MSEIFVNKEDYDYLVEIKEEFKSTVGKLENEMIENIKLKRALQEIKEIAEESMRAGRMLSGGWLSQKISEVEDE